MARRAGFSRKPDGGVIVFEANDDGIVTVELDFFSFDGENEFTIEIDEE